MVDNEIVLTMLTRILRTTFSKELLDADVSLAGEFYGKSLVNAITRIKIPSDAHKQIIYPDGWWNAVKDRFIPPSLKKIIRVKYIVVDIYRIFPELPPETIKLLGQPSMSVNTSSGETRSVNDGS